MDEKETVASETAQGEKGGRVEGLEKRERPPHPLGEGRKGDNPAPWRSAWPKGYPQPHTYQYEHSFGQPPPEIKWKGYYRILYDDAPREPYRRRKGMVKTVLHWGQRKLLFSEIEFLSMYSKNVKHPVLLYAGAAPGRHIGYLSSLFPDVQFVLVDPNPFSVKETKTIHIRQEFFTDELAREYAGKDNVLFVSDIRTADPSEQSSLDVEKFVMSDMQAQMRWHEIMRPYRSMFKFRLPWGGGTMEYLDGKVYLPVWGPQTTSETRLVVKKDAKRIMWDNQKYEDQCFYFNTHARVSLYPHHVRAEGLDFCFDCSSEVHILGMYIRAFRRDLWSKARDPEAALAHAIGFMSEKISLVLSKGNRILAMPQPHPGHRGRMGKVAFERLAQDEGGVDQLHRKRTKFQDERYRKWK